MPTRTVSFAEDTLVIESDSPPRFNRANAHVSNTAPDLEENRAELRCNMHGKIALLPIETFLETFLRSVLSILGGLLSSVLDTFDALFWFAFADFTGKIASLSGEATRFLAKLLAAAHKAAAVGVLALLLTFLCM